VIDIYVSDINKLTEVLPVHLDVRFTESAENIFSKKSCLHCRWFNVICFC